MEMLKDILGFACLLFVCALLYKLACYIGSKAGFYEKFVLLLKKFKKRKNDEQP